MGMAMPLLSMQLAGVNADGQSTHAWTKLSDVLQSAMSELEHPAAQLKNELEEQLISKLGRSLTADTLTVNIRSKKLVPL
eukprot:768908-Rhodomonas_salina.1